MDDKTEKVVTFREYLHEVKAREKSTTLREYTDRLLLLDSVREALDPLKDEGFSVDEGLIRITPWRKKIRGFEKPDLIISKEDILFQLYLVMDQDRGVISRDFLRGLLDVIQTNPNLTALVLIWNSDDLPSCALDAFVLRKYIEKTDENISLRDEGIFKVDKTIRDFYDSQFVDWSIPEDLVIGEEGEEVQFTLTDVLRQSLDQKFKELEDKDFKIPEKREAQKSVLKVDRDRLLNKLTDLLAKPTLGKADFDKLESLLERELKRTK